MLAFATVLSAILLARGAQAQVTTTLPWANGDTIVVSPSTNPINGVVQTVTMVARSGAKVSSTIVTGAGGAGGVGVTPTSSTTTTARTRTTTTTPLGGIGGQQTTATTATQRVVGQETSYPPMQTTTYGYDPGNGQGWISATWTASVTGPPTQVTAIVPAGTILDYNAYQSVINAELYQSAVAADASADVASNGTVTFKSAGERSRTPWTLTGLAVGGAILGAMMI